MKTQTNNLFNGLSKPRLVHLTSEVKETLAMDMLVPFSKKLAAVDVWNIQRHKRTGVQRRFSL